MPSKNIRFIFNFDYCKNFFERTASNRTESIKNLTPDLNPTELNRTKTEVNFFNKYWCQRVIVTNIYIFFVLISNCYVFKKINYPKRFF